MSGLANGAANGKGKRDRFPNDPACEQSILGGILLRNSVLSDLGVLEVDDFYDFRHKIVWQAIRTLQHADRPIDIVTLEAEIQRQGKLEAVGGVAYLGELALRVPTADNIVAYAETVRLYAKNRRAIITLASALERAQTGGYEPHELVAETVGELQRIEDDQQERADSRRLRWTAPLVEYLGVDEPSDDDSEDWIIRDIVPRGETWLWGGPMKAGKTYALLDLAVAMALGADWLGFTHTLGRPARVALVLREDNKRRIAKRLWEIARALGITPHHPVLVENLRVSREPLRLPDANDERMFIDEIKAFGADVVGVDNLTRVMVGDPNTTREAKMFTDAWTRIGEKTGASPGFLHHTRKQSGDGKQADPFDTLRGSGDFGATARNIIVAIPVATKPGEAPRSEVRMRGNLDLRRDGFVMEFDRRHVANRWQTRLVDRGGIDTLRVESQQAKKDEREQKKINEHRERLERWAAKARDILAREGHVTKKQVASAFGYSSDNAVAPAFDMMIENKEIVRCVGPERNLGFRAFADVQRGLI